MQMAHCVVSDTGCCRYVVSALCSVFSCLQLQNIPPTKKDGNFGVAHFAVLDGPKMARKGFNFSVAPHHGSIF